MEEDIGVDDEAGDTASACREMTQCRRWAAARGRSILMIALSPSPPTRSFSVMLRNLTLLRPVSTSPTSFKLEIPSSQLYSK